MGRRNIISWLMVSNQYGGALLASAVVAVYDL